MINRKKIVDDLVKKIAEAKHDKIQQWKQEKSEKWLDRIMTAKREDLHKLAEELAEASEIDEPTLTEAEAKQYNDSVKQSIFEAMGTDLKNDPTALAKLRKKLEESL